MLGPKAAPLPLPARAEAQGAGVRAPAGQSLLTSCALCLTPGLCDPDSVQAKLRALLVEKSQEARANSEAASSFSKEVAMRNGSQGEHVKARCPCIVAALLPAD